MKILLSIATVPPRFQEAITETLDSLSSVPLHKIVLIHKHYKKWGPAQVPAALLARTDVEIVTPQRDYGPATKLLGAIEYVRAHPTYTHIITFDDDINYTHPLELIKRFKFFASKRPNEVLTIGGIKLVRPPYAHRNGLKVHNVGYVDMVAGCLGTLYPFATVDNDLFFNASQHLPEGTFNDDDLYFGIVLSMLKIPIYSISTIKTVVPGARIPYTNVKANPDSAVQFGADLHRVINQMQIIQYAVGRGWLPNPFSRVTQRDRVAVMIDKSHVIAKIISFLYPLKIIATKRFCELVWRWREKI
jgi:hypothetical protein